VTHRPGNMRSVSLLALLVLASVPLAARAEDQQAAVEEFAKAKQAYLEGRYEDAIRGYEKAMSHKYSAKLHYNIGLACEKLGQHAKARDSFARYLKEEPGAGNAAEVRGRIAELERKIKEGGQAPPPTPVPGPSNVPPRPAPPAPTPAPAPAPMLTGYYNPYGVTVDFFSKPAGADLFVNGQLAGSTPLRLNLEPGATYYLACERKGYAAERRAYTVRDRGAVQFDLRLTPEGRIRQMTRSEWFGFEPMLGFGSGSSIPAFGLSVLVVGLKWHRFTWTILEAGVAGGGVIFAHLSTRPSFPFYFGARGQHQLRLGLGISFAYIECTDDERDVAYTSPSDRIGGKGLAFSPSLEYRYQGERSFFIGVALRPFVLATPPNTIETSSGTTQPRPWAAMLTLPIGWASTSF